MIKYETDSRKVVKGSIFVAIKGHTVDGHDFYSKKQYQMVQKNYCCRKEK